MGPDVHVHVPSLGDDKILAQICAIAITGHYREL